MKISEIDKLLSETSIEELESCLTQFEEDSRQGVIKLCNKYKKKIKAHHEELEAFELKKEFDNVFIEEGQIVVGIDEVGRGPLAGPVVAAAVILPSDAMLLGIKDSKKLSEKKREVLYDLINEKAHSVSIGIVDAAEIDELNILQATFKAMRKALEGLEYDVVLVDGDKKIKGVECPQHAIIKGDDKSAAIAAASIIAKVTRDRMMKNYSTTYPMYDWESNKGYGSKLHYEGISKHGITPLHRKTFLKNIEC